MQRASARCSSSPTAVGMSFCRPRDLPAGARDPQVRRRRPGRQPRHAATVIPTALPILHDGEFRGMCALGISLRSLRRPRVAVAGSRAASRCRWSIAPAARSAAVAEATRALPVAVAARRGDRRRPDRHFATTARTAQLYEFRLRPLGATRSIFVGRRCAGRSQAMPSLLADWGGFALVVLALGVGTAGGLARRGPLVRAAAALHPGLRRPGRARRRPDAGAAAALGARAGLGRRGGERRWPPRSPAARPS